MLQCFLILDNEERIWAKLQGFDSPRHQFHAGSSGLLHSPPDIVDIKPANMEELTEVITAAEFHPHHCNTFVYSSSKGTIRLCDMRTSALCDRHAKCECGDSRAGGTAAEHGAALTARHLPCAAAGSCIGKFALMCGDLKASVIPGMLWSLLWRCSGPAWMPTCAAWPGEPALAGGWTRWSLEVPSKPYNSVNPKP